MSLNNTTDVLNDVAILDITSEKDETPILVENNQQDSPSLLTSTPDTIRIPSITRYRITNVLRAIAFIEFTVIIIIWLTSSKNHFLVDDIIHYRFKTSIFDVVSASICKCFLLIILLTELETFVIKCLYQNISRPLRSLIGYLFVTITLLLTICSVAFSIIKFVFVIHENNFNRLLLSAVYLFLIFSSIEFLGTILLIPYLSRVKLIDQQRSTYTKKKVDFRRLLLLVKPERLLVGIGVIFLFLSTITQIIQPYIFGKIVDDATKYDTMTSVNKYVLILFGINCVGAIASSIRTFLFELVGQKIVYTLRQNIFNAIIKQEIGFFDDSRIGELTNRLSCDSQVLQDLITSNISTLTRLTIQIIGSLVVMFYLEVKLTLVLMVVVPVIVLISKQYGSVVQKLRKNFQDQLADAGTAAEEALFNIRTVRIFGAERRTGQTYHENLLKSFGTAKKLALNSGLFIGLVSMLVAGGISIVLWYGAKLVHDKQLSNGLLLSFLMYMLQVALSFGFLASLFGDVMQAVGASERIFALLDRQPNIHSLPNPECPIKPVDFEGYVRFDNVYFTYPTRSDRLVLRNISFEIKPGQTIALVGPSGGGKSTIASLIERFYDPDSGTIYLNSHPLTKIDPEWLRTNISFVNQEPSLFACSIRDNITFGLSRKDISLDDIQLVAKQANAHNFIEQFENKYDTLVGERGVRLSGGQRQRIAIARALLVSPKLLLLDEATSALDAESEHLVQEAIERAMINRTVLIIAHRLSTVRNADLVIVINQGEIVEQGTHDSLLTKEDGIYKKLVLRQLLVGDNLSKIDE